MWPYLQAPGFYIPLLQLAVLSVAIIPLGHHMAKVYNRQPTVLDPAVAWLESLFYHVAGIDPDKGMDWLTYTFAALTFSGLGFIALYGLLVTQGALPNNPAHVPGLSPEAAFSVTAGLMGGSHMVTPAPSPLSSFAGFTVQNFLSAAVGMASFVALVRSLNTHAAGAIGNFWADLVRTILYILLPLSLIQAGLLSTAGVAEALEQFARMHLATPGQLPVISEEILKLGATRTGGFATAAIGPAGAGMTASLLHDLSALLIPAALCYTFGLMVGARWQGLVLLGLLAGSWFILPAPIFDPSRLFVVAVLFIVATAAVHALFGNGLRYLNRRITVFEMAMAAAAIAVSCAWVSLRPFISPALAPALGLSFLFARFWVMIPSLAMAGSFAAQSASSARG